MRGSSVTTRKRRNAVKRALRGPAFRCRPPARKTTARSAAVMGARISTSAWPTRMAFHRDCPGPAQMQRCQRGRPEAAVQAARANPVRRASSVVTTKRSSAARYPAQELAPNSPPCAPRNGHPFAAVTAATTATIASPTPTAFRFGTEAFAKRQRPLPPAASGTPAGRQAGPGARPVYFVSTPLPRSAAPPASQVGASRAPRRVPRTTTPSAGATGRRTPTPARPKPPACRSSKAELARSGRRAPRD